MPTPDTSMDPSALLAGVVTLISGNNAMAMQVERLARDLGVAPGPSTIVFLTGVKNILRDLPDKAFVDKSARLALVDAVQDALDQAIEAEEDQEENREQGSR